MLGISLWQYSRFSPVALGSGLVRSSSIWFRFSGQLQVGDVFFCFDLHHPIEFVVTDVRCAAEQTRIICDGELGFANQFHGATVDSAMTLRPYAFRYDP